jgi:NAD(P)-dependent dehydrogenase (short-subunit alcohol dehydrogenase family)
MSPSYPPVPTEHGFTFAKRHHDTYPEIDPLSQSDCSNKAVLITGASRGIGLATALSYAAAGVSHLALAARSDLSASKDQIEAHCHKLGKPVPTILTLSLDVQDHNIADAAAKVVQKEFGRLDILVNNAGRIDTFVPIADSDPIAWWRQYEVNVLGLYLCTRAFLPLLLQTEGGDKTIINTTSIGAHTIMSGGSAYQTGKLAVVRFTEFIMHEYADQGILCYSIHPGGVATDMASYMTEEFVKNLLNDTVELPADSLVFLTQVRREWLAGRYVDLSWDMPELLSREEEIVQGDKLKVKLVV